MVSQLDPFLSVAANWFDEAFLDGLAAPKIPAPLDDGKWMLKPIIAPSDNAGPLTPPTLPASPLGGPPVEVEKRPRAVVAMASSQRFAWRRDDGRVPDIQSNAARGGAGQSPAAEPDAVTAVWPRPAPAPSRSTGLAAPCGDVEASAAAAFLAEAGNGGAEQEAARTPTKLQTDAGLRLMRGMLLRTNRANHTPLVLRSFARMVWAQIRRLSQQELEHIVSADAPQPRPACLAARPFFPCTASSPLAAATSVDQPSPPRPISPSRFFSYSPPPAPPLPPPLRPCDGAGRRGQSAEQGPGGAVEARRVRPRH